MSSDDALFQSLSSLTPELKAKLLSLLSKDIVIPPPSSSATSSQQAQITSLRKSNAKLQQDIHASLSAHRNAEKLAKEQINSLDASLHTLRTELEITLQSKREEEGKRRAFMMSQIELVKEKTELGEADNAVILDLQFKVENLSSENTRLAGDKKGCLETLKQVKKELANALVEAGIATERASTSDIWKAQSKEQAQLVQLLQDELEYERSRSEAIVAGEDYAPATLKPSTPDAPIGRDGSAWEWKAWMDRSWCKIWERDIAGLQNEISDLSLNKSEAFSRIQSNLAEIVSGYIPAESLSLAGLTSSLLTPSQLVTVNATGDSGKISHGGESVVEE